MRKVINKYGAGAALALAVCVAKAAADDQSPAPGGDRLSLEDNFRGGQWETALSVGPMFSPLPTTSYNRPTVNYVLGGAELGYMVTEPAGSGFLHGNFELAAEGFDAGIYERTGSYIAGSTLWFRYNFLPGHCRIVPFTQVGGGFVFTDIAHRYDGQNFNFNVDAAVGARYFVCQHFSVNVESLFQHISNADLGEHNIGINAIGVMLGASWFF